MKFAVAAAKIKYEGKLEENGIIKGKFMQSGNTFELDLCKGEVKKAVLIRPQNPKEPYPYHTEDVYFTNSKEGHSLAGTLTTPKEGDQFPAVILISGSGPQNRDEELMGHKPFLIWADHLTRQGFAVLRYDDRGTADSKGDFSSATSFDFAEDAKSAVQYLLTRDEIDAEKIGLMGHSEGGLIAPIVANDSKDVNFIILLAGTGLRGDEILLLQTELISRANGVSEEDIANQRVISKTVFDKIVTSEGNIVELRSDIRDFLREELKKDSSDVPQGMTSEEFMNSQISQITNPWFRNFMKYDPFPALEKVSCKVLAVIGEKDLQVPPKENLEMIEKALQNGKNRAYSIQELPNLNHLFQECETGAPSEYSTIEQTISPIALDVVTKWLMEVVIK